MKLIATLISLLFVLAQPTHAQEKKTLKDVAVEKEKNFVGNKRQADRTRFISLGPAFFSNLNSSSSGLAVSAGYFWNIENNIDLGLDIDFAFSTEETDIKFLNPKIEGRYIFGHTDVAPYVGAGFGYGFTTAHEDGGVFSFDDGASGFSMSFAAGLKFFRTSSVHLITDIMHVYVFDENTLGNPSTTVLRVGISF